MTPSVMRVRASTRELDEAAELLQDVYETPMALRADPPRSFRFATEAVRDDSFGIGRLYCGGAGTTKVEAFGEYCVAMGVGGDLSWRIGREESSGSSPFLILPGRRMDADWHDLDLVTVSLNASIVEEAGIARTGREGSLRLRDVNTGDLDLRYMRGVMHHLQATARTAPDLIENPLVRSAMRQAAVDALLASYPLLDGEADAAPTASRTVRRAMAFFDDHLGDPITVADAARVAGVSVRALELGFREHVGRTPREYLRAARLAAARAELATSDPYADSVQRIARRWGFGHLSRFAQDYRRQYGELPSATLRR
jgi:AraC-like DNA-binding protein